MNEVDIAKPNYIIIMFSKTMFTKKFDLIYGDQEGINLIDMMNNYLQFI